MPTASGWITSLVRKCTCSAAIITRRPALTNELRLHVLSTTQAISSSVQTVTAGLTELITPDISHEARVNYSNQRVGTEYSLDDFGGAVPIPDSGLFPFGYSSANSAFQLGIVGAGLLSQGKLGTGEQRQVNLVESLSVTKSRHLLKFGVDYRWLAPFTSPHVYGQSVQFSGVTISPGGALSGTAACRRGSKRPR